MTPLRRMGGSYIYTHEQWALFNSALSDYTYVFTDDFETLRQQKICLVFLHVKLKFIE